jgi:NAD(P)-dependent dehydrogenase (short-subunit alcohol dehydrogenase family)
MTNSFTLITGATSGIGEQIAITLSAKRNILVCGRDDQKIKSTLSKLDNSFQHKSFQIDLASNNAIHDVLKSFLVAEEIVVDCFVHCAGIHKILPLKNFEAKYYNEIFKVNFFSAVDILRTLLKISNKNKLENIVFISALFSKYGDKGNSMYAASKGALDSLVKTLAVELAPSVRVNSILPGAVLTKMAENSFNDPIVYEKMKKEYLLGTGNANDIASFVDYIVSPAARWITGQNFIIDGGKSSH